MAHQQKVRRDTPALEVSRLSKTFGAGEREIAALDQVSLTLPRGSFTAIMGPSGSGKSTFLNCVAGLETPTSGEIRIGGTPLPVGQESDVTVFRRTRIGIVFQGINLLPYLNAVSNVALPLRLAGRKVDLAHCGELLDQVGLGNRLDSFPAEMSGGQQQRVAIARALVAEPEVVFADEPTGALDSRSARQVLGILRGCADRLAQTIVMVTHDPVAAAYADSVLFLADGRVIATMVNPQAEAVAAQMTHLDDLAGTALAATGGAR